MKWRGAETKRSLKRVRRKTAFRAVPGTENGREMPVETENESDGPLLLLRAVSSPTIFMPSFRRLFWTPLIPSELFTRQHPRILIPGGRVSACKRCFSPFPESVPNIPDSFLCPFKHDTDRRHDPMRPV